MPKRTAPDEQSERKKKDGALRLLCRPPIDSFLFTDRTYKTALYVVDSKEKIRPGACDGAIVSARLVRASHDPLLLTNNVSTAGGLGLTPAVSGPNAASRARMPPSAFTTTPAQLAIGADGLVEFEYTIHTTSCSSSFAFEFECENAFSKVESYGSPYFQVVSHRLIVAEEAPSLWYKDQGGRDKCIELQIRLVGREGEAVTMRDVPLRCSLLYDDNATPVLSQDVLKIMPGSSDTLTKGTAIIRFRLEDVSKNHQSKPFVVRVEPDTNADPTVSDVSWAFTTPITVRSKLNRSRRTAASVSSTATSANKVAKTRTKRAPVAATRARKDDTDAPAHSAWLSELRSLSLQLKANSDTRRDLESRLSGLLESPPASAPTAAAEQLMRRDHSLYMPAHNLRSSASILRSISRGSVGDSVPALTLQRGFTDNLDQVLFAHDSARQHSMGAFLNASAPSDDPLAESEDAAVRFVSAQAADSRLNAFDENRKLVGYFFKTTRGETETIAFEKLSGKSAASGSVDMEKVQDGSTPFETAMRILSRK